MHAPVRNVEPYFEVDPVFKRASYAKRYQILLERLVLERKYTASCLTLATDSKSTKVTHPTKDLAFRQLAVAAEAHARVFIESKE